MAHDALLPIQEVLGKPRWNNVETDLLSSLLGSKSLTPQHIRDLDGYLSYRESLSTEEDLSAAEILKRVIAFSHVGDGLNNLRRARKALLLIFVADDIAAELAQAISSHVSRKPVKWASPGRSLQYSVPHAELPTGWQLLLSDMHHGMSGVEAGAPAIEIVRGIGRTLRQFAKTALDLGLKVSLSKEAAIAFEKSLKQRPEPLAPYTVVKYLLDIKLFAAYAGAGGDFMEHMKARYRFHSRRAHRTPTRAEFRVAKIPDFRALILKSLDMLSEAKVAANLNSAHALRNRAAALALVSPLPLRISDLALYFGSNITWTGDQYHLTIPMVSKSKRPYSAYLHPVFGRFIDYLVLHERPASQIEAARDECMYTGRALFINRDGQPVSRYYVSRCWWRVFGTGSHVARAKLHDEFARLGPRG